MNTADLASAIIDVQEPFDVDELITISAMPDNRIVREFFSDPRTGSSILKDYTDPQLDGVFSGCNTLTDATRRVANLYASKPLNADEAALTEELVLRATMDAAYEIAEDRRLDGSHVGLQSILTQVVIHTQKYVGTFKP